MRTQSRVPTAMVQAKQRLRVRHWQRKAKRVPKALVEDMRSLLISHCRSQNCILTPAIIWNHICPGDTEGGRIDANHTQR